MTIGKREVLEKWSDSGTPFINRQKIPGGALYYVTPGSGGVSQMVFVPDPPPAEPEPNGRLVAEMAARLAELERRVDKALMVYQDATEQLENWPLAMDRMAAALNPKKP